jgi:hypothetical protein
MWRLLLDPYKVNHFDQAKNLSESLAVIKCIDLLPTYLHFIHDIEDRCLLLTSSTSFVGLSFQEHRMTESIIWTKIHAYLHYVQNKT